MDTNYSHTNVGPIADPRGGMKSHPTFSVDAMMDGPFMRDGETGVLSPPSSPPVNGEC